MRFKRTRWYVVGFLVIGLLAILFLWRIRFYTSPESPPSQILAFNPSNCFLPCVMGVVPGETGWSQTLQIVSSLIPTEQIINQQEFWVKDPKTGSSVFISLQREAPYAGDFAKLIELRTDSPNQITSLGVLLDEGYIPSKVFRARTSGPNVIALLLTFENHPELVVVVIGINEVNASSPIRDLFVLAKQSEYVLEDIRAQGHFEDEITWMGFASVNEYWQQLGR
jgi:hypothetical protein